MPFLLTSVLLLDAAFVVVDRLRRRRPIWRHRADHLVHRLVAGGWSPVEAVVVLLGDQPGITPAAVAAVVAAFRDGLGPVVQASYGGRAAHPTLLARSVWAEVVSEATGDEGRARSWPPGPTGCRWSRWAGTSPRPPAAGR